MSDSLGNGINPTSADKYSSLHFQEYMSGCYDLEDMFDNEEPVLRPERPLLPFLIVQLEPGPIPVPVPTVVIKHDPPSVLRRKWLPPAGLTPERQEKNRANWKKCSKHYRDKKRQKNHQIQALAKMSSVKLIETT